jgi:hypothetical protein
MALIFLFLNIRSLTQHKPLFQELLLEEHITTFILNETLLTPKHNCKLPGYTLLRCDSTIPARRANGGVAIGFPPSIPHRAHAVTIPNLPEYLIATIYYRSIYITIATIYIRPGHPIPMPFFRYISNNYRHYIIMADVNIHSRPAREKSDFHDFIELQTTGTIHRIPQPTRPISNTTPDIVITSITLAHHSTINVLDPLGSDHVPVKLTIQSHHHPHHHTPPPRTILRFDKADWLSYRQHIQTHTENIVSPSNETELYSTLENLNCIISQATNKYIPKSTIHPHRPNLPPHYLPLITKSRALYKDYKRTGDRESLQLHRQYQRTVHNYIKAYKLRQWTKTCNSLADTSHPSKYWKRFNSLTGKYTKTTYPLLHNNEPLHSDVDKANAFADYLQDIFTPQIPFNPLRRHPADSINFTSPHL